MSTPNEMTSMGFYFHNRLSTAECPAGVTVSRSASLPSGDFRITEFISGGVTLWFVDADKFDADERWAAFCDYVNSWYDDDDDDDDEWWDNDDGD